MIQRQHGISIQMLRNGLDYVIGYVTAGGQPIDGIQIEPEIAAPKGPDNKIPGLLKNVTDILIC
jgi:hypothetical protein